ncbi:MAG: hypothetical protein OSB09_00085 [Planctomycetota bacterium]|nr:hypothetical protein [Planctomycetota bacterium]
MPKVSIQLLRGGILLFNISAMTLLGFVLFDLLLESPQGVKVRLVNPQDFELKEQAARPVPNQYRDIIGELYRSAPQAPVAVVKPVESTLPSLDTGPIGEWEIVGVIFSAEGQRFASIQEKGQTNVLKSNSRNGRATTTTRVRGRAPRGGGASPTSRLNNSRTNRSQVSNQRVRYLEQGKEFRIDENRYMVVEIQDQPKQVIYEHNGRSYTLRQESITDPVIHEEGQTLVLRGFSPEEMELLSGSGAGVSAAGRVGAIPGDERGWIRGNDGKEMRGTAASKPPSGGTPPRGAATRSPTNKAAVNPRSNNRNVGDPRSQRRGAQVPPNPVKPKLRGGTSTKTPKPTVRQTTLEGALGVDVESNPQEAIRRLKELQRARQQNQPN